jgi:hypothetical protein
VSETLVFARRYRGPHDSANGGYAAGALARLAGGTAEVTLRLPPPLERQLAVERRDGGVVLLDGDALVAEAAPAEVELEAPEPVSFEEAQAAAARHVAFGAETFRGCFSCGALREPPDGLCIYPGRVEGRDVVAAPWVAREPSPEVVWAAIDCSGAYAVGPEGRGEPVLGRMAARIERLPREGERCVVLGWPRGADGRKLYAGTALYGEGGELLAVARQTWIQPRASGA